MSEQAKHIRGSYAILDKSPFLEIKKRLPVAETFPLAEVNFRPAPKTSHRQRQVFALRRKLPVDCGKLSAGAETH